MRVPAASEIGSKAIEELQHVDNFLRIMAMLGVEPQKPSSLVELLATGMMGSSWAEHVALEMAAGEGFVLLAFYALIDTIDHPGIVEILARAVRQQLGLSEAQLPLARVLQGGTWAAGRELAQRLRGGLPPLQVASDGTVF